MTELITMPTLPSIKDSENKPLKKSSLLRGSKKPQKSPV
jgi:hypothetical protein